MNNLFTYLTSALKWIASNRLNYLASTSALLLIIHFPANLQLLLGLNVSTAIMTLAHYVIGSAWLAGFLPNRTIAMISRKAFKLISTSHQALSKNANTLLSSYAQTH